MLCDREGGLAEICRTDAGEVGDADGRGEAVVRSSDVLTAASDEGTSRDSVKAEPCGSDSAIPLGRELPGSGAAWAPSSAVASSEG